MASKAGRARARNPRCRASENCGWERQHLPGRVGGREGGRQAGREGGREAGTVAGRERGREGGMVGGREGRIEGGRSVGREASVCVHARVAKPSFALTTFSQPSKSLAALLPRESMSSQAATLCGIK